MANSVTFISMNCQGLSNKIKRADTLNFLKGKKIFGIYVTRYPLYTHTEENYIRTQWGFECYFSNFALNARGVAVFLNNNFECKVYNVERDDKGNMLILETEIESKMVLKAMIQIGMVWSFIGQF